MLRGGKTWPKDGKGWIRDFVFEIPIRRVEIWERPEVRECLAETLGFLSDDNYRFSFRELPDRFPWESYFDFKEDEPWYKADEVLLFSGGLDSLAGAVEEIIEHKKRALLVSHRPVAKIAKRQIELVSELARFIDDSR